MAKLTEDEILAYTLLGEAVGEGPEGMAAVMHVLVNRGASSRYPAKLSAVALEKSSKGYQFSTWGESTTPDKKFAKGSAEFKQALSIVRAVKSGALPDPTGGALNYYANKGASGIDEPWWFSGEAKAGSVQIGNHVYAAKAAVDPAVKANYTQQLTSALQGAPVPATMSAELAQRRAAGGQPNVDELLKNSAVVRSGAEFGGSDSGTDTLVVVPDGNDFSKSISIPLPRGATAAQKRQALVDYFAKPVAKPAGAGAVMPDRTASFGARESAAMGVTPRLPSGVDYTNPADIKLNNISEAERKQLAPQIAMDQSSAEARRAATVGGVGSLASGVNLTTPITALRSGPVKVKTVPINPYTGQPTTAEAAEASKSQLRASIARAANGGQLPDVIARAVPGAGLPSRPATVPPSGRVDAKTVTVRADGTTYENPVAGSVQLPVGVRPNVPVPKLPVPAVVRRPAASPGWIPFSPYQDMQTRGAIIRDQPQAFTSKLVTQTVKIKNPNYVPVREATAPTGAPLTAAERTALSSLTGTELGVADVPVEPEFIEKQITVEQHVPVLGQPNAQPRPAATYSPPAVKIATGKTARIGQAYKQGADGKGRAYTYQVQGDGSIKNLTTGRITAPATR